MTPDDQKKGADTSMPGALLRRAARIFLPLLLVVTLVMLVLYQVQTDETRNVLATAERQAVDLAANTSRAELASLRSDLLYLANSPLLISWLDRNEIDSRRQFAQELLVFSRHRRLYDQVRLLDLDGHETVRVDWNAGQPALVADSKLQDKSARYYVRNTRALARGEIFVSPFDLNIENGVTEQPLKPVIRLGTPVFDSEGRKRGILVLNYRAQRLIDGIAEIRLRSGLQLWLVNADGYWLHGPDRDSEWGFIYPERAERRFDKAYPDAWAAITQGTQARQFMTAAGLFAYSRLVPRDLFHVSATPEDAWILVAHLPAAVIAAQDTRFRHNLAAAAGAFILLFAGISWAVAHQSLRRRQGEQAQSDAQERYRALVCNLPVGVYRNTPGSQGCFLEANPALVDMFEAGTKEEFLARTVSSLYPDPAQRRALSDKILQHGSITNEELQLVTLKGRRFWASITSVMRHDSNGDVYFDGIVEDISARKATERRIEELNTALSRRAAELEATNRELEAFSYSVSHDLRAPLRAVDGFSQALRDDYAHKLDAEGRGYLDRVRTAAQRMGLLIDDLIKLSRVTRSELQVEDVDLSKLVADVVAELRGREPQRRVETDIEPGLVARGDARLLRVALENLLGNAWKFTAGRSTANIVFGRGDAAGIPAYFVRDDGVGFDMAYAGKLFAAFQRLHDAHEFPGTGIGLATVQRVMHKHGGRVWAQAVPGAGATFYFTL